MRIALYLLVLSVMMGCGADHTSAPAMAEMTPERMVLDASSAGNGQAAQQVATDRRIVRTGELQFEVDALEAARSTAIQKVLAAGGLVEGDDQGEWGSQRSVTLRFRIPADRFDAVVQELQGLGRLEQQHINATDVTTEWVDVEARLKAKRTVEARYMELAGQARQVSELLEVERALGDVRAEIESMEARMRSLRDQVAMSTLTVTCIKQQAVSERFAPRFGVALREGWNNLLRFLVGLTNLWPFVLVAAGLVWWWRRRRRGKA